MLPEIETYISQLRDLRGKVLRTLEGLDPAALNWKPLEHDANSLFVLATHLIGSEHGWIAETLGQGPLTRKRSEEFLAEGDSLQELHRTYEQTAQESERILAPLTEKDLEQTRPDERRGKVTLRWIVLHVIEHYSEHLGQMYLTRQLQEEQK